MSEPALPVAQNFEEWLRRDDVDRLVQLSRFFMKSGPVHDTLRRITKRLDELAIPYAVAGGMALNAHGYTRATTDVDILVNPVGLLAIHKELEGLGYVPPFAGSKNLKDAATGVRIEFLVTGQFPGDGKPKPVAFPEPVDVAVKIDGVDYISLPTFVDLKLASGMTGGVTRLKDLADVISIVQELALPRDFAEKLNAYVRPKYEELWDGIQSSPAGPS